MENFEDELTCSVCYNIFNDPRILPCSHTFCRNCLENVVNSSRHYSWRTSLAQIKCPSCRSTADLPLSGILSLPINFALKSIVEKYKTENHCKVTTCPEHNRQPLNVFCLKDRKLICGQCLTIGHHQGHAIDDLENAFVRERETASKYLRILSNKQFTGVSAVIKTLEEQMNHCKKIVQDDKKDLLHFFETLSETLEQKKQKLLAALNDVGQEIGEVYAAKIEEMKQIQDEELDLISLSSSVQEESSPIVYLENIHNIRERMKALKKKELIPIHLVEIHPRARQFLKNIWLKTNIGEINQMATPKINICFAKPENDKIIQDKYTNLCILLVIPIFIALLLFIVLCNTDIANSLTARYWTCLSKIVQPVLEVLQYTIYSIDDFIFSLS
ncbi:hypothetical protein GDO86_010129 [Hymenochirus boettgeri]|uniref:Tripartite motif-containing protein 59 n=1 Tax=Hymenochirus boettgeri TaxID=247094 RepID=A0A8T2JJ96_9PIPI|nr:hypothetical protein GDO86_010129 [Hymenochirus boettgeri]